MSLADVLFLPEESRWCSGWFIHLFREGESLDSDHEGEEVREVVLQNIVEDMPPPPKPKKKGKISNKKKQPPKP